MTAAVGVAACAAIATTFAVIGGADVAAPTSVTAEGGLAVSAQQPPAGIANAQTVTGPEPLRIVLYTDYTHPDSARFASSNALVIQGLVQDGAADVSIVPVAVSDEPEARATGVLVGNAVACVSEYAPKSLWSFQMALLAMQPQDDESQLRAPDLVTVARDTGVQNVDAVTDCIGEAQFSEWVETTTADAQQEGVGARSIELGHMPVVLVDDALYQGSIDSSTEFRGFVSDRIGDRFES